MFCNVDPGSVFTSPGREEHLRAAAGAAPPGPGRAARRGPQHLDPRAARSSGGSSIVEKVYSARASGEVRVGIVGKYVDLKESYKSLNEALLHGGIANDVQGEPALRGLAGGGDTGRARSCSPDVDAILVPGGFGVRGTEGKIAAVRYAREKKVPFFGICLGLQMAVVEFARNVLGLAGANSLEFDEQHARTRWSR